MSVKPKHRDGVPTTRGLRWNLQQAQREFGVHREMLERRRRALAIEPGEDGCYTSRDIAAMLFGDKEAELIGKLAAERKILENELARRDGEIIRIETVGKVADRFLIPARQRILSCTAPDAEKDEILADLVRFGEVDWKGEAKKDARGK